MRLKLPPLPNRPSTLLDWSYWLSWGAVLLSLLYLVSSYGNGQNNYRIVHNSDASFLWVFYRDSLARGTVQGWELPTNPYLFPDMLLFIPIDFLVDNINLSSVLFGIAQLLITLIGLLWLQRELFGPSRLPQTWTLLAFTLTILLISTWKHIFHYLTIMPLHHFGVLMVMPYALVLLLRALHPGQTAGQWLRPTMLLFVLIILTTLSDFLFAIQFTAPALLLSYLRRPKSNEPLARWRLWSFYFVLALSLPISHYLREWIAPTDKFSLYSGLQTWDEGFETLQGFFQWGIDLANTDFVLAAFWLSSIIALGGILLLDTMRLHEDSHMRPISLVASIILLSSFFGIASTLITDNFGGSESGRYFLSAIYMPLWVGWLLFLAAVAFPQVELGKILPARYAPVGTALLSLGLIGYMLATFHPAALAAVPTYQDPRVTCLLQETAKRNLRYGLAEYWQANYLTAVTEGKLRVVTLSGSIAPDLWNSTPHNYEYPFEFILVNPSVFPHWRIEEETLYRKFGPPQETFQCEDYTVYDYTNNLHLSNWFPHHPLLANFEQIGQVAEFYGYTLHSQIKGSTIGFGQGANEEIDHRAGILAYAPFVLLPAGSYAVALDLFAERAGIGSWEVHTIQQDEREVIYTEPITQTGDLLITGTFTLAKETNVDIVVKYDGAGKLDVDRMRLVRVDPAARPFDFAQAESQATAKLQAAQPPNTIQLLTPYHGQAVNASFVDFAWQWNGEPLTEGQTFEVRLWHKGEEIRYGAHDAAASRADIRQVGSTYLLRLDVNGAYSVMQHTSANSMSHHAMANNVGEYEWSVALVTIEPTYQETGIESTPFALEIQP